MSEELKACPFCGGPAVEGKLNPVQLRWRFIVCAKCATRTAASCDSERVKARWNRRAPSPELLAAQGEAERMRGNAYHLVAMLLRLGLVKGEWFETWHNDFYQWAISLPALTRPDLKEKK